MSLFFGDRRISGILFKTGDRLHLADLVAICQFSTESSLGLSLRRAGAEVGSMDVHLADNERGRKAFFRLSLRAELSTRERINQLRRDCYRALAILESTFYEIRLFRADRSVLIVDDREGIITTGGPAIPPDVPLLD